MNCPSGQGRCCPNPGLCGMGCHFNEAGLTPIVIHKSAGATVTEWHAAESNPGYAYTLLEADSSEKAAPNVWHWLQDLLYTAVYVVGSVTLGVLLALAVMFATGLHRVFFY